MSAITGTGERRTISGSAWASSRFGTATRTISQPADASAAICAVVASTSCVFVSVIDCTTTGAPPPIGTPPTLIWCVLGMLRQRTPRAGYNLQLVRARRLRDDAARGAAADRLARPAAARRPPA